MLAQNFMTAADLGITEAEVSALIKVLVLLELQEIKHVAEKEDANGDCFNMNWEESKSKCGTVRCIGGWAAHFMGQNAETYVWNADGKLRELFFPHTADLDWDSYTTAQAATALRNYLTTGDAQWADVIG